MAQRRMISKSISTSTRLSEVSTFAALLFTWIIPHCDDYGHLDANPKIVKAIVVPLRDETAEDVAAALKDLVKHGLLTTYEADGRPYLEIVKWDDHQTFKTDRPLNQQAPLPADDLWKPLETTRKPVGNIRPRKISEEKISEGKRREEKKQPHQTISYLRDVPKEDIKEFSERFNTTEKVIRSKAEDLLLYCERKAKSYHNYRSFLLNALKRDLGGEGTKAGGKYEGVGKKKL